MTDKAKKLLLREHAIEFKDTSKGLEVLDISQCNGKVIAVWILCPVNLLQWLGY